MVGQGPHPAADEPRLQHSSGRQPVDGVQTQIVIDHVNRAVRHHPDATGHHADSTDLVGELELGSDCGDDDDVVVVNRGEPIHVSRNEPTPRARPHGDVGDSQGGDKVRVPGAPWRDDRA